MTFSILAVDNLQSAVKIQDRTEFIDVRAEYEENVLCTLPIPFAQLCGSKTAANVNTQDTVRY